MALILNSNFSQTVYLKIFDGKKSPNNFKRYVSFLVNRIQSPCTYSSRITRILKVISITMIIILIIITITTVKIKT